MKWHLGVLFFTKFWRKRLTRRISLFPVACWWVLYLPGKKTDFNCFFHFLLEGHELPHSIKFSQLRDLAKTDDPMVSLDGMEPEGEGKSSEFILQNRLKGSKKHSFGEWYHLISHTLLSLRFFPRESQQHFLFSNYVLR